MKSLESALAELAFTSGGEAKDASLARLAVDEALSEILSAATAGDAEELRNVAQGIFRKVPANRPGPSADAWVAALEVLARAAQRLYELTAPRQQALSSLANPTASRIFAEIAREGRIRARDLRQRFGIEDQSNLARTIRKLVRGELVAVEHDSENAAWYRPTLAGRRLAHERLGVRASAGTAPSERVPIDGVATRVSAAPCRVLLGMKDRDLRESAFKALESLDCDIVATADPLREMRQQGTAWFRLLVADSDAVPNLTEAISRVDPRLARRVAVVAGPQARPAAAHVIRWPTSQEDLRAQLKELLTSQD